MIAGTLTTVRPRRAHAATVVTAILHCVAAGAASAVAAAAWALAAHLNSGRVAPSQDLADGLPALTVLLAILALAAVLIDVVLRIELGRPPIARRHLAAPALIFSLAFLGQWPLAAGWLSLRGGCILTAALLASQCTVLAAGLVRGYVRAMQRL